MIIEVFPCGAFATNAIIIGCEETKKAILIDPAERSLPTFEKLLAKHGLTPIAIYLTHSHWDHIADLANVQEAFGLPIYVHEGDAKNVESPGADGLPLPYEIKPAKVEGFFKDQDKFEVGNLKFEVIHLPGHTPGGVGFFFPKYEVLISGDTLFKGSIGRIDFPTTEPDKMWISLKKLSNLPKSTKVYPGHGETTTIAAEDWLENAKEIFG